MKPRDRRSKISSIVNREGARSVEDLAEHFDVSLETIRRDLSILAEEGALQKVHGGAKPMTRLQIEPSFQERMVEEQSAKRHIGELLVHEIRNGATVFMDTGTTTLAAAAALLAAREVTVVTNSHAIAQLAARTDNKSTVHLLGGYYQPENGETVGPITIEQISQYQADYAILGVAGFDPQAGAMDADPDEAAVARAMVRYSDQLVLLATKSKIGRRAAHRICTLDQVNIVLTDEAPAPEIVTMLDLASVDIKWEAI